MPRRVRFEEQEVSLYEHMQRPVPLHPLQGQPGNDRDSTGNRPCDHWKKELQEILAQLPKVRFGSAERAHNIRVRGRDGADLIQPVNHNLVSIHVATERGEREFLIEGGVELTDEIRAELDSTFVAAITTRVTIKVAVYDED